MAETPSHRSILVIAESGVNYNGWLGRTLELVDAPSSAGSGVMKFRTSGGYVAGDITN